jgi:hypothetical protein
MSPEPRTIAGLIGEKGVLEQRLKAETSILEQRLKLSEEARGASNKTSDEIVELTKRLDAMEVVVAKSDYALLSESVAEIRFAIGKVSAANNAVTMKLNITEAPDVANFTVDTESLDFALYGAHKKLDPETRKQLQDGSSPFINIGAKKKND